MSRLVMAKTEHEVVYQELIKLCHKHAKKISALEILAIASNMVGKLMAFQDQRTVDSKLALSIVAMNIEEGNRQAIAEIFQSKGSA